MPLQLQYDNQSEIPVGTEDSFVEFEQDGKQVYMHVDLATAKKDGFKNLGQLNSLTKTFDTYKSDIAATKLESETKATAAEEEARQANLKQQAEALEKQKKELLESGETEKLHKLTLQAEIDKNKSLSDSKAELQKNYEGLQKSLVEKDNRSLANKIANEYTTTDSADSLGRLLIMDRIIHVDGKSLFIDASGNVISDVNDMTKIKESLSQDLNLKHFEKSPGSKPGVGAKGGSSSVSTGKTISSKDYYAKPTYEQAALIKSGYKIID